MPKQKSTTTAEQAQQASPLERLLQIMAMLRDAEFGCPWDLQQSIASLVPFTLEEVYEVVDAIERNDMAELQEELGDLLFQVVFYAQLGRENGLFDFNDIARTVSDKLVRRHPHVFPQGKVELFGNRQVLSAEQVVVNWEAIKQTERSRKQAATDNATDGGQAGLLDDVPRALPAMARAGKLQQRAAAAGFDWPDSAPVLAKLKEEVAELEAAWAADDKAAIEAELGDVLFALVNLSRHTGTEAEVALRGSNRRFEQRFRWIESALHKQDRSVHNATLDELDQLWEQAKRSGL